MKIILNSDNAQQLLTKYLDIALAFAGLHGSDLLGDSIKKRIPAAPIIRKDDDQTTTRIKYAQLLDLCISRAISSCSDSARQPYKQTLAGSYLQKKPSQELAQQLGYGQTQFFRIKKRALLQFSGFFDYYQVKLGLRPAVNLNKLEK